MRGRRLRRRDRRDRRRRPERDRGRRHDRHVRAAAAAQRRRRPAGDQEGRDGAGRPGRHQQGRPRRGRGDARAGPDHVGAAALRPPRQSGACAGHACGPCRARFAEAECASGCQGDPAERVAGHWRRRLLGRGAAVQARCRPPTASWPRAARSRRSRGCGSASTRACKQAFRASSAGARAAAARHRPGGGRHACRPRPPHAICSQPMRGGPQFNTSDGTTCKKSSNNSKSKRAAGAPGRRRRSASTRSTPRAS